MKAIEGEVGRVFVLRLDHDDALPQCIEDFAAEKDIKIAQVVFVGGVYQGNLVTGPRKTEDAQPDPIVLPVSGAGDTFGSGIIAPGPNGQPVLHMHGAHGRSGQTMAGCFQKGVKVWLVGEAVLYEILSSGATPKRVVDPIAKLTVLDISE